jgi:hypothetical protein
LRIHCHRELLQEWYPVKNFDRVLIFQAGSECILIRFAPIERGTKQAIEGLCLPTDAKTEGFLQQ